MSPPTHKARAIAARAFVAETLHEDLDYEQDFLVSQQDGRDPSSMPVIDSNQSALFDGAMVINELRDKDVR